jgi:Tfp pilus assembly protein PilF
MTRNHLMTTIRTALLLAVAGAMLTGCAKGAKRTEAVTAAESVRISEAHSVAFEASRIKDPAKSSKRYADALNRYDDFPAAWNNYGVSLMQQGEYLDAEKAFARAAEQSRTDPRPLFNRGLLWLNRHYPADARRYFNEALNRDPYYLPALRGSVECDVMLRENTAETLDRLRRALMMEKDPKWLERLESQRVKIQSQLSLPESPRSLDEVDLMTPIHDAAGMPVGERERQMIEEAVKARPAPAPAPATPPTP